MHVLPISIRKTRGLINNLNNKKLGRQPSVNVPQVRSFTARIRKGPLIYVKFDNKEEVVVEGELKDKTLRKHSVLKYANVPLGVILKGEIVVLENGKGVKMLLAGDFIGLFETAYFLASGIKRKIGKWTLIADTKVEILFFSNVFDLKFKSFLVNLARSDIVPKPITDLPLLDFVANKTTESLLDNTIIIAHTHILPSNFSLLRHFAHLVGYNNLFVVEKPYSTIRSVFNKLIQMGVEVIPVVMISHAPYELSLKRSLDLLWDKVIAIKKLKGISRIILIDDGGDLLLSIPWGRLGSTKVVGVEQTQRGINRIADTNNKIPFVINVASSFIKKDIESTFIAKAIVEKIKDLGILSPSLKVGIIGFGSIGNAISERLRKDKIKVINYDILYHNKKNKPRSGKTSIDTIINESGIIIGCTGSDFLKGVAFNRIYGKKTFISASSADVEFFSLLNMASFSNHHFKTIKFNVHSNLSATILNGGYPINFDRIKEWELAQDIQVTRCLLYIALLQSLNFLDKKSAYGKLIALDKYWQKMILSEWPRFKRNKTFKKVLGVTFAKEI